jgi:hypothetical protein
MPDEVVGQARPTSSVPVTVIDCSDGEADGTVEAEGCDVDRGDVLGSVTSPWPVPFRVTVRTTPAPMSARTTTTARATHPLRFGLGGGGGGGGGVCVGCVSLICVQSLTAAFAKASAPTSRILLDPT